MKFERIDPPYDHPRMAYQHLLKYDDQPNIPKLPPHCPVTLYARNTFINYRPYESFEAILRFMPSNVFHSHVIVNLQHFRDSFNVLKARKIYRLITGERFAEDDKRDPHAVVWNIFQKRQLVRMKAAQRGRGGNSYLFDLEKIRTTNVSFPKQCKVIMATLLANQRSGYTLDELRIVANDLHKHGLKTKQDPFKILQYYLPQLHDAGFVEYPRKQYNSEEDSGDNDE